MGGKRRRDGEADVASRHAALTRWLRAQGAEMRGLMIRTAPGGGSALYAHTDFSVGQSIGGLPTLAILDPLSVLHRDPVALSALARGATEPFAFWLALAVMATDHTAHFYAYLMACPQEAPEPCAWPAEDRRLLEGTPLAAQVEAQRKLLAEEYSRIAPHVAPSVPFDVNGVGAYPSLLWARGVHMSRCFPRALVEAAVLKTPHEILASDMLDAPLRVELGGSQPATFAWSGNAAPKPGAATDGQRMLVASAAKVGADVAAGTGDREATESGGSGEPMCNASTGPPARQVIPHCAEPAEQPRYNSGEANCLAGTLGALLPGLDMMDHASGHPIGWEAGGGTVRFRCRVPVAAGEPLYNNYGPKGNAELLFTYGFALMDNPMDTVEGIWVARSPAVASCAGEKGEEDGENGAHSTTSGAALMAARVELLEEYDVPYVTKEDGTLLMGPFELKSPPQGVRVLTSNPFKAHPPIVQGCSHGWLWPPEYSLELQTATQTHGCATLTPMLLAFPRPQLMPMRQRRCARQ